MRWRATGVTDVPFKGPMHAWTYLDSHPLSSSAGAVAGKAPGPLGGETELSGFRMRVGGAAFSQSKVLAEAIVPLLSPPCTELAGGTVSESPSTWRLLATSSVTNSPLLLSSGYTGLLSGTQTSHTYFCLGIFCSFLVECFPFETFFLNDSFESFRTQCACHI